MPPLLSGTVTELTCDAYSKTEADGRYATAGAISAVDARVTALENSGGVPADISCTSLTASSAVNALNFTATGNTTGVDALFTQDVQTPLLRPISAVDDHLRIAAGLVSTRMVDNDGATVLAQFSGAEVHTRVPTRCDQQLTIDDVSGPATGLLTNAVSARIGDDLLTINGGTNGVTVLGAGLAVAGVASPTRPLPSPKRYDRADVDQKDRLGFLAQDLQNGGVTGKTIWGGEELLTLDYGKLTAVLWGVCKKLQARVEALEKPKKPKTRRAESPRGH